MSITKKHNKFIDELFVDLNATQAAIRAGYSPKAARQTASRMLTKADIRDEVERRMADSRMKSDEVIARLTGMAQGTSPTKTTIIKGKTVAGVTAQDVRTEYDVLSAVDKIGRIYALFVDKQVIELEGLEIIDDDEEADT